MTMMSSFGGGCFSLIFSLIKNKGRLDILDIINGVLASLVAITAGCFLYVAWESILIGVIGAALGCITMPLIDLVIIALQKTTFNFRLNNIWINFRWGLTIQLALHLFMASEDFGVSFQITTYLTYSLNLTSSTAISL